MDTERTRLSAMIHEALASFVGKDIEDVLKDDVAKAATDAVREWLALYAWPQDGWRMVVYTRGDFVPDYFGWVDGELEIHHGRGQKVTRAGTVVLLLETTVAFAQTTELPAYVQVEAMPAFLRGSYPVGVQPEGDDNLVGGMPTRAEMEAAYREAAELLEEGFDL